MNDESKGWSVYVVIDELRDYHASDREDGIVLQGSGTHIQEDPPAIGRLDAEFIVDQAESADEAVERVRVMLTLGPGDFEIIGATEIPAPSS